MNHVFVRYWSKLIQRFQINEYNDGMTNLEYAKQVLKRENKTAVLYDGKEVITDTDRGIRPLLKLYNAKKDVSSFSAADKVVGKGAAFLYVLLKIKELHTGVISTPALEVLKKYGIPVSYDLEVEHIINHSKTGFCPIETAIMDIFDPLIALPVMIERLKTLKD